MTYGIGHWTSSNVFGIERDSIDLAGGGGGSHLDSLTCPLQGMRASTQVVASQPQQGGSTMQYAAKHMAVVFQAWHCLCPRLYTSPKSDGASCAATTAVLHMQLQLRKRGCTGAVVDVKHAADQAHNSGGPSGDVVRNSFTCGRHLASPAAWQ